MDIHKTEPADSLVENARRLLTLLMSACSRRSFIQCCPTRSPLVIASTPALPSDYFPEETVASAAGLGGVGAGIGAILYLLTTG